MVKILWDGVVFHPTGVATHHRNMVKALLKLETPTQVFDLYNPAFDPKGELKKAYEPIDVTNDDVYTILTYGPSGWTRGSAHRIGFPVHEGSKLPPGWAEGCNQLVERLFVPSKATKNLFYASGVKVPIDIVPEGVDPKLYNPDGPKMELTPPKEYEHMKEPFVFLSVNSWMGDENDRKGTDILIRAFAEEFKKDENVVLLLKVSTFFAARFDTTKAVQRLGLPADRAPIITDDSVIPEEYMPRLYRSADCFVSATRGESWGLTIGEAMACGCPIIVPKNREAGYMDFVKDFAFFCDTGPKQQADRRFFCEGNMMPTVDKESLKKTMRKVYEMSKDERKKVGEAGSLHMRTNYSWNEAAKTMLHLMTK